MRCSNIKQIILRGELEGIQSQWREPGTKFFLLRSGARVMLCNSEAWLLVPGSKMVEIYSIDTIRDIKKRMALRGLDFTI